MQYCGKSFFRAPNRNLATFAGPKIVFRHRYEWFGQPLPNILLAFDACRLEIVDTQTGDNGDEKSPGRVNLGNPTLLPTNERLLQNILCIGRAAQHAIGDGE